MASPRYALEFEKPLIELERKIEELKTLSYGGSVDFADEIVKLERKARKLQAEIFSDLTRWQVVQLSRHPDRPYTQDYLNFLFTDFYELHGDRSFAEDPSIIAGFARFDGIPVAVIGHQKGRNTKENMHRNFGMPRPEGYRKAERVMELANRFRRPLFTFIDTPGAYPGIGAEERGQAEAIAVCLEVMSRLEVPVLCTIIGEGGSGGALAVGVGNRVLMLEHSWYCVIAPESASAILYRDSSKAEKVAESLRLTANDLMGFGVVDEVVRESAGGAHRDPSHTAQNLGRALRRHLQELSALDGPALVRDRYERFRRLGPFLEE
ncbi:MAG: acetyl-CoA carboxylase carboxyltransferase subunit alpha [Deltaproteobacteria bacterium]|nr:acetyl-CoA carboxylase carboxyltransferase subunit alpha [Deltaproteobacteria bacterium]